MLESFFRHKLFKVLPVLIAALFFKVLWGWFFILLFQQRTETSERYLHISLRFLSGFYIIILLSLWPLRHESYSQYLFLSSGVAFGGMAVYSIFSNRTLRLVSSLIGLLSPIIMLKYIGLNVLLSTLVGSIVLGGTLVSQFLGHWYLNVVGLPLSELKRSIRTVSIFVGIKFGELLMLSTSGIAMKLQGNWGHIASLTEVFSKTSFWIIAMRALFGIIAPALFYWMTFEVLRERNTQSATGILYATSALVLMGELLSLFIYMKLGVSI